MKKLLIVGAGTLQTFLYKKAKEMGVYTIAVDIDMNAPGFSLADEAYVISTHDKEAVLKLSLDTEADGITTIASEVAVNTIAYVAKRSGLLGLSEEAALAATDKSVMRDFLAAASVSIPEYRKVNSEKEFIRAVNEISTRIIVKPSDSSGSRGVTLIDKNRTENNLDYFLSAYHKARDNSKNQVALVEEYIEGEEFSVESITYDGETKIIAVTKKLIAGSGNFVEMGHSIPADLDKDQVSQIKETVISGIQALGIDFAPCHSEVIVSGQGIKIVEIAARLGGDYITSHLVPYATSVDILKCVIQIALGIKPEIGQSYCKGAAVRYLKSQEGIIRTIEGIEYAKKIKGVKEIFLFKIPGDMIHKATNSLERLGCVIAQAETAREAEAICEQAVEQIIIEVE